MIKYIRDAVPMAPPQAWTSWKTPNFHEIFTRLFSSQGVLINRTQTISNQGVWGHYFCPNGTC